MNGESYPPITRITAIKKRRAAIGLCNRRNLWIIVYVCPLRFVDDFFAVALMFKIKETATLFLIFDDDRPSDSRFVERVWRSHSEGAGTFHSIGSCNWEMVVTRHEGKTSLTVRGPETRATTADYPADGEWFAIRFKLGTFMPLLRPGELRDRNDVTLPDATSGSFWLNSSAWEYPNFENAETFVKRLEHRGLIAMDHSVIDLLRGQLQERTIRTAQRHFLKTTGVTHSTIRQIERARHATNLLKDGVSILDTVYEAGYYDQAHLTRSLRYYVGQTPGQIIRAEQQLSFLYNTESS